MCITDTGHGHGLSGHGRRSTWCAALYIGTTGKVIVFIIMILEKYVFDIYTKNDKSRLYNTIDS